MDTNRHSADKRNGDTTIGLSVVIITRNEERNIAACLESVPFAEEIIILDSSSTDRTVEIARSLGAQVFDTPWFGYGPTKQLAVDRARGPWILSLDADERVTPELASEILRVIALAKNQQVDTVAYAVPRKTWFVDRWIMHSGWYPGYIVRLFRKEAARFTSARVHEGVMADGPVKKLRGNLLHYSYNSRQEYLERMERYATLSAEEMFALGRQVSWRRIINPSLAFLKAFVLKAGFLDGPAGWDIACLSARYVRLKYHKLGELRANRVFP